MPIKRFGFTDNFRGNQGGYRDAPRRQTQYAPPGHLDSPLRGQLAQAPAVPKVQTVAPPAAPAKPVTPQQPAAAAAGGRPSLEDPAIASDPVLMKVKKLAEGQRGNARASAVARKKQLAIEVGDAGLAREFGLDDTVAETAAQNPLSAFAAVREAGRLEERDLEEALNKANLHFSGYRGTQLGELAKSILAREAHAQAQARQAFSTIEDDMLAGLGEADRLETEAEMQAYDRAVAARASGLAGSVGVPSLDLDGSGGGAGDGRGGRTDQGLSLTPAPPFGSLMLEGGGLAPAGFVRAAQQDDPSLHATVPLGFAMPDEVRIDPILAEMLKPRRRDPISDEMLGGRI